MNNEEFYKNLAIRLLNAVQDPLYTSILKDFPIEETRRYTTIIDIKRKLMMEEKRWYKTSQPSQYLGAYILGKWEYYNKWIWKAYVVKRDGTHFFHGFDTSGADSGGTTLIAECTPEEVEEIEKKLRQTYYEKSS